MKFIDYYAHVSDSDTDDDEDECSKKLVKKVHMIINLLTINTEIG